MKVRTLKRSCTTERECAGDVRRHARNLKPHGHAMQRAREYTRALNAAKMERMFAKPFLGQLGNGHGDAVTCTALSRRSLAPCASGSADGTVHLWDLATRKQVSGIPAHDRAVTGLCFSLSGQQFYSCSEDGFVHQWSIHSNNPSTEESSRQRVEPTSSWKTNGGSFKSIDHHWMESKFATASDLGTVQIWSPARSAALQTHENLWGSSSSSGGGAADTVNVVRFHPAEHGLLAHASVDRGIGLHDTRTGTALRKAVLRMRCNDVQWNPMEPMNFVVANEDYQCYGFDMRNLRAPTRIYKGHVGAVMSISWSPTGREFVTGSYDRTIRIFKHDAGTSRDVYHTKRMQRVLTVQYTADGKYVLSGSDDTNLRLWKSEASERLGASRARREEVSSDYRKALIKRYRHMPAVQKIIKSRNIPKAIKNQTAQAAIQKESADRKHANRVKYDRKGEHKFVPERNKTVVQTIK